MLDVLLRLKTAAQMITFLCDAVRGRELAFLPSLVVAAGVPVMPRLTWLVNTQSQVAFPSQCSLLLEHFLFLLPCQATCQSPP